MKNLIVNVKEATEVGYVRVGKPWCEQYKGKYGQGIKVHYNNPNSTRYNIVRYYIVSDMTADFYYEFCRALHGGLYDQFINLKGKRAAGIAAYNYYQYSVYDEKLVEMEMIRELVNEG